MANDAMSELAALPATPDSGVDMRYVASSTTSRANVQDRLKIAFVRAYAAFFREMWPFSAWWPAPTLAGMRLLVRYDHVVEALGRPDVFGVPFGEEMGRLNGGGGPGLLGTDDPTAHAGQVRSLMARMPLGDIDRVRTLSLEAAVACLRRQEPEFDAIGRVITAVPLQVCRDYFGVPIPEAQEADFAAACIELSSHLFGVPPIKRSTQGQEDRAGAYVRHFIDQAIEESHGCCGVPRSLAANLRDLDHAAARAVLMSLIVGFVPTNTLAGGYVLDTLLGNRKRNRNAMQMAVEAARTGDDDRLWQCLLEALRLRPINLGPFRLCKSVYCLDGVTINKDEIVWVMTASAMRDSRQVRKPWQFDPARSASAYLHFGSGMHWCIGAMIARAQLTQTFKALLAHGDIERRSPLRCRGTFPAELKIRWIGRDDGGETWTRV